VQKKGVNSVNKCTVNTITYLTTHSQLSFTYADANLVLLVGRTAFQEIQFSMSS